ncbi:unnamed protein product, partial [Prunus brigantina]
PPYYDVPQVLDSIRYRLVHEIGQFGFVGASFDMECLNKTSTKEVPNIIQVQPQSHTNHGQGVKLYPFAKKNLDENVLHLFENTLVLGPHRFGSRPNRNGGVDEERCLKLPYAFKAASALASHSWISKNLSRSFPSSEVRNSPVKWADWIDRLLPRYGAHW